MINEEFTKAIAPFFWIEHSNNASICLNAGEYKQGFFASRKDEGFEGNGYDWTSLAQVFVAEKLPELQKIILFDPEAGMFCAYSSDADSLRRFAQSFKQACENNQLIKEIFSKAELD